jgi:hypothetical protein
MNNNSIQFCFLLLAILLVISGCKKQLTREESAHKFLTSDPKSKDFQLGLQGMANHLYHGKWPDTYNFTKPKIRHEKMIVEWEHKVKKKTKRKYTNLRCNSNIERLSLSCLIAATGPINLDKLMRSNDFKLFTENLKTYLGAPENREDIYHELIRLKLSILKILKITEAEAKLNEVNYKSGVIITTGFYMGFPFFKRITLDSQISNREEYLRVYLHECGHQLFDKYRNFKKTLKLGFSWIGWAKSTDSWWIVEEKSCNLFSELILESFRKELEADKRYQEPLATADWIFHPLEPNFKTKYAPLFYNPSAMLEQLKNARINNRYSTTDAIAKLFRERLTEKGIESYIKSINTYLNLKDVLIALNADESLIKN